MARKTVTFPPEARERAVRWVVENAHLYPSRRAAVGSVAALLGCSASTVERWLRAADVPAPAEGDTPAEREAVRLLRQIVQGHADQAARLRRLETWLIQLMRTTGVSLESLRMEPSDSQKPASSRDVDYARIELTRGGLVPRIERLRALTDAQCRDVDYLEHVVIPELGLAEEEWSFPEEVAHLSGKGLHLLQLPCQVAPFLVWLADHAQGIRSYLEIGVRWGGMFILVSEWLRRFSPEFRLATALDPADMSPLIAEYDRYLGMAGDQRVIEIRYVQEYSTSVTARDAVRRANPDLVFIDGDHSYEGVRHDHELVGDGPRMILFHDIVARNWPGVGRFWQDVREQTAGTHVAAEFVKQYKSGDGGGMGLGLVRRSDISLSRK